MNDLRDYTIGVIGAGSWGTTLAHMLAEKGYAVTLWVYEQELLDILQAGQSNAWYLPDIELDKGLRFTGELEEAVADKNLVLWVTPVKAFRECFGKGIHFSGPDTIHASASKGIENETFKTVSQIAAENRQYFKPQNFAVLSGPSFAHDVSHRRPTAVVIASRDPGSAATVQKITATSYFRTYTSEDILGVELGGALKNVMAIASGIIEGLGLGNNTQAALFTRGLAEIIRLGTHLGADPRTFAGLSGVGDLMLTCTSTLSRNYRVGMEIGKGKKLDDVLQHMKMVAEGVYTTRSACALCNARGVDMPIVQEIHNVLFENKDPRDAVRDLMSRDLKQELA